MPTSSQIDTLLGRLPICPSGLPEPSVLQPTDDITVSLASPSPTTGLLSAGTASRLPHLADSVLGLDPLSDDSQLHRLLPDPARWVASVMAEVGGESRGPRTVVEGGLRGTC